MPQRGAPQFGASLPHDRRRERPVGPGQFHSERRIRAGRVVPPGRCGFAMVRRSGGATARPLDSIWSLSAAWSPPGEARRTGPVSFREANQSGPCGASRAVRICHGAPQQGRNCPATGFDLEPLCRMVAAGRGPSDRASFIQRGESERAVWCLPGGADLPWCAAAGAQLPGHWSRFGPLCRMIAAGRGPSDQAMWCLPGGADLPWCAAAGAQLPGHWIDLEPLCRMVAAGRGPSDRASFIQRGESERAKWCLPGGADLPWCAAAGAQLPGHWSRFGPLCRMIAVGRGPSDRASFIQRGESERAVWCLPGGADSPWCAAAGAQLPGHWSRFGPLCRMVGAGRGPSDRASFIQRGESERAVWCLPGGADLPWCAAAGAQLPGHWTRFGASLPHGRRRERPVGPGHVVPPGRCGFAMVRLSGGATARPLDSIWASLPHGRRRERPVGPGQFHSERRIRAGRVVPPGRCGFAMVRRSGGATARPLESIWASLPHDRRRERPVGPGHVVPSGRCGFAMVRRSGGATARPLDSIWASLPHGRRRERPVGPGQFHSERRIRAGRVVPPGRCGFAMVRRSGGATARPLDSIWSLSAA